VEGIAERDFTKAALNGAELSIMVSLRGGGSMKTGVTLNSTMTNACALAATGTWGKVDMPPPDPIFGISEAFKRDERPEKVLLGVGAYRTDEGKPYVLDCVKKAEAKILAEDMDHEYSSIDGMASFREKVIRLGWGADSAHIREGRIFSCQAISGTGSLRVGMDFLR